jgi:3'-phosphoadenosine 5'-phosphosulfate sulfotransferase (PAPS reductase)/FAD synthetase
MKILQFSGGIDSLACLLLLRDMDDLTVLTVVTDGVYSSTLDYLEKIHAAFPSLHYVTRHSYRRISEYGHPVDVVPLRWTAVGQLARGKKDVRYQDAYSCCNRGFWEPLDQASRELGATVIYRGQRHEDRLRAPVLDGHVDRGVELRFPLADWTRQRVFQYVEEQAPELMPPGDDQNEATSRDCWDCTAYLQDNHQRITNLPFAQHKRVNGLFARWRDDVETEMEA